MGSDDLFKKRKKEQERRTKHQRGQALPAILIFCGGKQTEVNYFKGFRLKNTTIEGKGKSPNEIVYMAIDKEKDFDEVWCVFDKDDFKDIKSTIQRAEKNSKIKVAYSNESFELWFLLHFEYLNTAIDRKKYIDKITSYLKKDYAKNSTTIYNDLLDKQQEALTNAKRLYDSYEEINPDTNNPSTTVHLLVEELNKYKK